MQMANEDNDQTDEATQEHSQWMFLCQLQPTPRNSPEGTQVNWDEAANQMPPLLLGSKTDTSRLRHQLTQVDVNCLNEKQLHAYRLLH